MLRYPFDESDFIFVQCWSQQERTEAAKLLNLNLKRFLRTPHISDIYNDIWLFLYEGKVKVSRGPIPHQADYAKRSVLPSDITNFLNKHIKRKYFSEPTTTAMHSSEIIRKKEKHKIQERHADDCISIYYGGHRQTFECLYFDVKSILTEDERTAIEGVYIQGYSMEALGSSLGKPTHKITYEHKKAINKLKKAFEV